MPTNPVGPGLRPKQAQANYLVVVKAVKRWFYGHQDAQTAR